ncbi:hypothetical protein [Deinococcus humi]|uniref:Uncharacterized protein n=1 Tax=Deinococcus humi TaxID=662880 RepID=A0A7W8K0C2_9DEIO|nr:hypothetical protein [Deinococcus humi]MBB5366484.1 hypothetical protein [Deinococcus humi]
MFLVVMGLPPMVRLNSTDSKLAQSQLTLQWLVDHPANPQSLRKIAAGGAVPIDGETAVPDLGLLDALAAQGAFSERTAENTEVTKLNHSSSDVCPTSGYVPDITNGRSLIACLRERKYTESIAPSVLGSFNYLAPTLILAIKTPTPIDDIIVVALTAGAIYQGLDIERKLALYPKGINSTSIKLTQSVFTPTSKGPAMYTPMASAGKSNSFNYMTAIASTLLGLKSAVSSKVGEGAATLFGKISEEIQGKVKEYLLSNAVKFEVGPFYYGDVSLADVPDTYTASLSGGNLFVLDTNRRTVYPKEPLVKGSEELKIELVASAYGSESPAKTLLKIETGSERYKLIATIEQIDNDRIVEEGKDSDITDGAIGDYTTTRILNSLGSWKFECPNFEINNSNAIIICDTDITANHTESINSRISTTVIGLYNTQYTRSVETSTKVSSQVEPSAFSIKVVEGKVNIRSDVNTNIPLMIGKSTVMETWTCTSIAPGTCTEHTSENTETVDASARFYIHEQVISDEATGDMNSEQGISGNRTFTTDCSERFTSPAGSLDRACKIDVKFSWNIVRDFNR